MFFFQSEVSITKAVFNCSKVMTFSIKNIRYFLIFSLKCANGPKENMAKDLLHDINCEILGKLNRTCSMMGSDDEEHEVLDY